MVALLAPNTFESGRFTPYVVDVPRGDGASLDGFRSELQSRPELRVLDGGLSAQRDRAIRVDSNIIIGLLAVFVVIAAVLGVRMAQGTPPAEFGTSPAVSGGFVPVVEAGDLLVSTGLGS